MEYRFSAYTVDRKIVAGIIDASSEIMAENVLLDMGYHRILHLEESRALRSFRQLFPTLFKIKDREIIEFTRELIYLVNSGITIVSALHIIEGMTRKDSFRKTLKNLIEQIVGGKYFSQAISSHPHIFSNMYCQVVKAGEESGDLEESLMYIADYMEKREEAKKAIKRALIYPAILLTLSITVVILLITIVLPPLADMFTAVGGELPLLTRLVIAFGDFFNSNKLQIIGVLLVAITSVIMYRRTPSGKKNIDKLLMSMPMISYFIKTNNLSNFCQTVAMLIKSGVTLPRSMSICNDITKNTVINEALVKAQERVIQGKSLSQSLAETSLFPQATLEMIAVGEKSGKLESALAIAASYHSQKMEREITNLISIMEPTMILIVGAVIGIIALSLISTIYSLPAFY